MTLTILAWIVIGIVVLGLAWLIYTISDNLNTDTKTMSIPERLKWTYPSWMEWMMNVEFEEDEILFVLQGIPTSMYKKIARTNIEHHVLTATEEFNHSGIVVRKKDLAEVLRAINFASVNTIQLEDRKDIRIMSVESKDHQLRAELFLQNYLEGIRGVYIDEAESKVLEKRRAYQDSLSQLVKVERNEAAGELSTEEAQSSRERWAYKLYDDLLHHPDILRIDIQKKPGSILIYTDDIVVQESGDLPAAQGRKAMMFFLGKVIVEINLSTGETRYFHENGRMSVNSDHQAPHVRSDGYVCWGSHTQVVSSAVENRNYLKAFQEAINFLKYANTKDAWGETAFKLKVLDQSQVEEIERNKLKRAKRRVPNKIPQLSTTSKYVIQDKGIYRTLLDKLKIKYLVLDDDHRLGINGLLITDASKVNVFLEQIIQPNETVRVDATAQNGVRMLNFTVDDQQKLFVDLMLKSWSGKVVNMVDTAKQEKEKLIREIQTTRSAYMKILAGQYKSKAQIKNEDIQKGLFSFLFRDIYNQLIAIPDISSVEVINGKLVIFTHELYVKEAKLRPRATELRCYNLGPMRIEIDFSMRDEPVRCFRQNGTMPKSDGFLQAPHVDKSGTPIWGLQELRVVELMGKLDLLNLVKEVLKFLQTARLDDVRGKYVQYLPEVDILELPQLELSKKQTKESWLEEKRKRELEDSSHQYEEILINQTVGQAPTQNNKA